MIREQRWQPDTCANPATGDVCSFIELWDDTTDPIARTHDFLRAEKLCSRHAAAHGNDHSGAYRANYEQNRRKNVAFLMATTLKPDLSLEQFQSAWSFRSDGTLLLDFGPHLLGQHKTQLQTNADIQFGPGKVVVA